jgi:hypothetical protein
VGQPELNWILADQPHAELRHRVTTRCALDPLTGSEVAQYIRHCLERAGATSEIFRADAVAEIAALARGSAAAVNAICERALLAGHRGELREIGPDLVAAIRDAERPRQPLRPGTRTIGGRRARPSPASGEAAETTRFAPAPVHAAVVVAIAGMVLGAYSLHAGWLGTARSQVPEPRDQGSIGRQITQPGDLAARTPAEPSPAAPAPEPAGAAAPAPSISSTATPPNPPARAIPTAPDSLTSGRPVVAAPLLRPRSAHATPARVPLDHGASARVDPPAVPATPAPIPGRHVGRSAAAAPLGPAAIPASRSPAMPPVPDLEAREPRPVPARAVQPVARPRLGGERDQEGSDPGSVIDWLMREHVPANR